MEPTTESHDNIATALIGLVKQIKALRYYPPRHPALQAAAKESLKGFQPLLGEQPLCLTVRKDGFLVGEQPLAKTYQVLGQLAMFCFARRIQYLTILPDLSATDLHRFVHCLLIDPQEIVARGGIQTVLEHARVTTIWVNEQDLQVILARKQQLEALPPGADLGALAESHKLGKMTPAQMQKLELEKLLKLIEQEQDDQRFRHRLQELIPLLRLNLSSENRQLVLRAMALLCRLATAAKSSDLRRTYALNAVGQLATDEMTDYLAHALLSTASDEQAHKLLSNVLVFLGDKVVRRLMILLAEEVSAAHRKSLARVLIRIGPPVVAVLHEYLFDERWYVVRNAVTILGEIRNQDSLPHLTPLLAHKELRVRLETVRALTKIGGPRAVEILVQAAESDDQELRRQALLSLGVIRAASAVPTLLKLLDQRDWSRHTIDMKKDAIRALGEIRSSEALAALTRILGRRRLLRRSLHDELRVAAAVALGDIGDEGAREALEKAAQDRSAPVARAAVQALMQLEKDHS